MTQRFAPPLAVKTARSKSMSRFARLMSSINATRRRAGGRPGAAPDRRAWNRFLQTTRDQLALPDRHALTVESHADMPTLFSTRAGKRKIIARARTPKKHSAPECWSPKGKRQQRSGVQTQFWSVVFIGDSLLQVNRNYRGRASTR
jgi:hypothetical protein